jgi:hypothetical protein
MRRRRKSESGFALLLVFVLAAAVSILLYREAPRVVFESQRVKEEMLIERGEQYKRGIQLYVRKFQRYPATLDDLEKSNNIRFLRRRYKDPLTNKDEWRLIHIDGAGALTNSKVQKVPNPNEKTQTAGNTFVGETTLFGTGAPAEGNQSLGLSRRASDRPEQDANAPIGVQPGDPNAPQQDPNLVAQQNPGQYPQGFQPGQPYPPPPAPGGTLQPGQSPQGFQQAGMAPFLPVPGQQPQQFPNQPGAPQPYPYPQSVPSLQQPAQPFNPQQALQAYPPMGLPVAPGQAQPFNPNLNPQDLARQSMMDRLAGGAPQIATSQPGSQTFAPFQPFAQANPQTPAAGRPGPVNLPADAARMIQEALTRPRPGGFPGVQPQQSQQNVIGGGIAGVASKYEGEAIKRYNERSKFDEWEFVYDRRNDRTAAQQMPGAPGGMPGTTTPPGGRPPGPQLPGQPQAPGQPFPPQFPPGQQRPIGGVR